MTTLHGHTVNGFIQIPPNITFTGKTDFADTNLIGDTYYVRNTGSDSATGKTVDHAFKTLEYAVHHAAGDWDLIRFLPATDASAYLVEASSGVDDDNIPIVITQTGLKIFGGLSSERQWGTPALHTHTTTTMLVIDAHQVEIGNMAFHDQGAGVSIDVAHSGDYWRTHIHDCYFGGNNTALTAIIAGNVGGSGFGDAHVVDAPCTTIERCYFIDYATSAIYANCGYGSVIRDCSFFVPANSIGITVGNSTTSRPHLEILGNKFSAKSASTSTGINVVNTPSAGYFFVDRNQFLVFGSDDLCCTKRTGYFGLNYGGSASGVTVVAITT